MTKIPFFMHDLGQAELDSVAEVFSTPILTTGGKVKEFEQRIAAYLGVKHALAVSSCTGALHLSLLALGIGPGDEVITTPMTFIATATAILEAGARPVFVDVEPETGNLDANRVEAAVTPRTRAILPVHLYGQMCDMAALRAIADRHGLALIEDSAHCLEGRRDGIAPGQIGDTACFSFYATKNLTCGEGGMAITNDSARAEKMRLLSVHGMTKTAYDRYQEGYRHWDMVTLGWKYNMSNIEAAILLPQLERLEGHWQKRQALAMKYQERLAGIPGVSMPVTLPGVRHACHLFPIWVDPAIRDQVVQGMNQAGIGVVINYRAIHTLTYFRETLHYREDQFPNAKRIGDSTLSLPFYPTMPDEHVEIVTETLRKILASS
ncbi:MAG: DegT/DnrJ/EryC1/StrS family aminotransferase [bacterium]